MLRRVLVIVLFDPKLPVQKDSMLDIGLLRLAHQALVRQQSGITDSFLCLLCGEVPEAEVVTALASYGFPELKVVCVNSKDENGEEIDEADKRESIGDEISQWLQAHHPAAITSLHHDGYEGQNIWWSGLEAIELVGDDETLPSSHRAKASTWQAILSEVFDFEMPCWSSEAQFALHLAALCEWLHGFEAACGNGYNDFEAEEVCAAYGVDDFHLGFLLGQSAPHEDLDEMLYDAETDDLAGIKAHALKLAVEQERSTIRDGLSKFFGDDMALFWALHTAIWPKYNEPSADACNELVNPSTWEDVGELMEAWEFVTDGWTERAD